MFNPLNREPAVIFGAVQAGLACLVTFGLHLSTEQTGAILALTTAVLALAVRQQVSPVAALPPTSMAVTPADTSVDPGASSDLSPMPVDTSIEPLPVTWSPDPTAPAAPVVP